MISELEKIHQINDLEWAKHELIWNMLGKYKIYIRISETNAEFIPFSIHLEAYIRNDMDYIFTFIQHKFHYLYFLKKRGIFETLYLIEREIILR